MLTELFLLKCHEIAEEADRDPVGAAVIPARGAKIAVKHDRRI